MKSRRPAAMPNDPTSVSSARLRWLSLAGALLIAGCGGAATTPAPTVGPTPPPTAGATPGTTAGPTSSPTGSPVPTAQPPTATPQSTPGATPAATPVPIGKVDHPTDPTAVVLRVETGGGMIRPGLLPQAPVFTLFGDNTAIFRPTTDTTGTGFPPFLRAMMNVDQVDALLAYALDRGRLRNARDHYVNMQITDAATTVFTIDAGGVKKQVSAYALGMDTGGGRPNPDKADLDALNGLAMLLADFETQVKRGQVESVAVYEPDRYRAMINDGGGGQPQLDWPWSDLTLDDFKADPEQPALRYAGLTPDQAAKLGPVPSGGIVGINLKAPDGSLFALTLTPMLPGDAVIPPPFMAPAF